ncbi:MAG: hypothetical protein AB1631_31270 [Acidobacteriota bacterium]
MIRVELLSKEGLAEAQAAVALHHYLRCAVDARSSPVGYSVHCRKRRRGM